MAEESYPPVKIGDTITIVMDGRPTRVEAVGFIGPGDNPEGVQWDSCDSDHGGEIPYLQWQRAAYAQARLAESKNANHPADPDELAKLRAALDKIGRLTKTVGWLELYARQQSSPYLRTAARDMREIQQVIFETTSKIYEELT